MRCERCDGRFYEGFGFNGVVWCRECARNDGFETLIELMGARRYMADDGECSMDAFEFDGEEFIMDDVNLWDFIRENCDNIDLVV